MPTIVISSPSCLKKSAPVRIGAAQNGSSLLKRCIGLVEKADWDGYILRREKWLNRICLLIIGLSITYLAWLLVCNLWR